MSNSSDIYINGRFLTKPIGGVQRFSLELVKAIDRKLANIIAPAPMRQWILLVPRGISFELSLKHIQVQQISAGKGHLWDQLIRLSVPKHGVLLNFANSGPIFCSRSLVVIHDAGPYRTPRNFTFRYRVFHRFLGRLLAVRSKIGTVSEFSRRELSDVLGLKIEDIFVVPNSCDHMLGIEADRYVLEKYGLVPKQFFLIVGSPSPNKNLPAALTAYEALGPTTTKLVIVGATDSTIFGKGFSKIPEGVILAGRVTDAQVVALMREAMALIFPSLYEGFGIPPLEAMGNGCAVIAAKIPPVLEVCGNAAIYFEPDTPESLTNILRSTVKEPGRLTGFVEMGRTRAAQFSWSRSAQSLLEAIDLTTDLSS